MDSDFFQHTLMEKALAALLLCFFVCVCVGIMSSKYQFTSFDIAKKSLSHFHKACWYFSISSEVHWSVSEEKLQVILKFSKTRVLHLLHMLNIPLLRHILLLLQKNSNFSKKNFRRILSQFNCKINSYCEWRATRVLLFIHNLIILQLIILRILHPTPSLMGLLTLILVI